LGFAGAAAAPAAALSGRVATETDLQLTTPLLWILLALSVAGALVTYAFLVYAVWKFRDPKTRGRRHG
jgi:TRAP-type C4-dicarboxylate transport system permease small subunit